MEFRIQARLCLAVYDFEAHIMLSLCLTLQGAGLPIWETFPMRLRSNVAAKGESLFSNFY